MASEQKGFGSQAGSHIKKRTVRRGPLEGRMVAGCEWALEPVLPGFNRHLGTASPEKFPRSDQPVGMSSGDCPDYELMQKGSGTRGSCHP